MYFGVCLRSSPIGWGFDPHCSRVTMSGLATGCVACAETRMVMTTDRIARSFENRITYLSIVWIERHDSPENDVHQRPRKRGGHDRGDDVQHAHGRRVPLQPARQPGADAADHFVVRRSSQWTVGHVLISESA